MSGRKRHGITEADVRRWLDQGIGAGEGKSYRPWLPVQAFGSRGRATRVLGVKTGRVHHLHSDLEFHHFLLAEFDLAVTDIREQYPLPRQDTALIAHRLGVRHPRDRYTGCLLPMTTDLLLTRMPDNAGKPELLAVSTKHTTAMYGKRAFRALQKLLIERSYWRSRGVRWVLCSEEDIDRETVGNIAWVRDALAGRLPGEDPSRHLIQAVIDGATSGRSLSQLLEDAGGGAGDRECLDAFRTAIWQRHIWVDLSVPLYPCLPVQLCSDSRLGVRCPW